MGQRQCACCGQWKNDEPGNFALMIRATVLTLMLVCFDCIDFMWKERNPDYAAQNENAETPASVHDGNS